MVRLRKRQSIAYAHGLLWQTFPKRLKTIRRACIEQLPGRPQVQCTARNWHPGMLQMALSRRCWSLRQPGI